MKAAMARAYMQEEVENPELVFGNVPALPRFLLYNYYKSNYLHMKYSRDRAIVDSRSEMSLYNFEDWGQKELSIMDSDLRAAFQKWQLFGYKYEVDRYLHFIDIDSSEEDRHLRRLARYLSMGVRSVKNVHLTIYPFVLEPENWYQKLKVK